MTKYESKPPLPQDPKSYCGICHGKGWFEGHDYSSYSPKLEIYPCPLCSPVAPLGRRDKLIVCVGILMVLGICLVGLFS